jgi:7 transmembrane receptor (rhodopsin family)
LNGIYKSFQVAVQPRDGNNAAAAATSQYSKPMRNTLKTVFIVVVMYCICWTPGEYLWALQYFGVIIIDSTSWTYHLCLLAQFSYCFINPLIYAVKYKDFRQGYARLMVKVLPSNIVTSN